MSTGRRTVTLLHAGSKTAQDPLIRPKARRTVTLLRAGSKTAQALAESKEGLRGSQKAKGAFRGRRIVNLVKLVFHNITDFGLCSCVSCDALSSVHGDARASPCNARPFA